MKSDKTYIGDEIDLYYDEESQTIDLVHCTQGTRIQLTPASYENLFNYATQIGFKEKDDGVCTKPTRT